MSRYETIGEQSDFDVLHALLVNLPKTYNALPEEERTEYARCIDSVLEARRQAALHSNHIVVD